MTRAIGVEVTCPFTPGMLRKVGHAGTRASSFDRGAEDLAVLAEVTVSREQVQRWTKRVGDERVVEVERQAEAFEKLPLPEQRKSPTGQSPQVACVQLDGGRMQIRSRQAKPKKKNRKGFWRETLVGCCLSMTSTEHETDPCPIIPQTFVHPQRIHKLSREIKGFYGDEDATAAAEEESVDDREGRPALLVKSVVATRQGPKSFGKQMAAEAYSRGFAASQRKACVCDGSATNWAVQRKHFSHYTPILDFIHAICYVYAAAMAGRRGEAAWRDYCQWAQWLWSGQTSELIAAVEARSKELGLPEDKDETSPAAVVARTVVYLKNQRSRMKYPEYRRLGMPITSSYIESTIKQVNQRVKGTEKFWDEGAEPILKLVAADLSETPSFDRFWKTRHQRIPSTRRYGTAA